MNYDSFMNPPQGYGEVAFFWWHGDPITKEKLTWILDQLASHHISGLQVNYCHGDQGGRNWGLTMESDPKPLSEAWWKLFCWFMGEAQKRGMAVSLSDYTLSSPGQESYTDQVLKAHPEFNGQLLVLETAVQPLKAEYYDLDRLGQTGEGVIWRARVPWSLNPMAEGSGATIADAFYGEFERRMPGECGRGLNFFFSDELVFNVRGRLWCDDFPQEFLKRKGYDLLPRLGDLFDEANPATAKTRLDYYDVIVQLSEERYFRPVYDWHQRRGMTFGCDHGGRGRDVTEFGDYFRAMRWNQGPGNDQPKLASDIIKTKVNSSIAHLYERPRTWLEGFYSSGWQTSSADVADAVFRNFALGHNLLSLHGLYYSTHGSYWEWAPPCNHHHMPYWQEMETLLGCTERLSWLLSQGRHCCDVAIVYPVAAMEADPVRGKAAVQCAFETGEYLYTHGIDFDFIDFESIDRSVIEAGRLRVAGESYSTVVVPNMQAARFSMMAKLDAFAQAGGRVVILGSAPEASDRVAGADPQLAAHVSGIMARCEPLSGPEALYETYRKSETPDIVFPPEAEKPFFQHRRIDGEDLYLVYRVPEGAPCGFRAKGKPVLLDPFSGERYAITDYRFDGVHTYMPMVSRFAGLMLVLFTEDTEGVRPLPPRDGRFIDFTGEWVCRLEPTLDNAYGDYRLPAVDRFIGAEARDFDYRFEGETEWSHATCSYAPYLYVFRGEADEAELARLDAPDDRFKPYSFSMRYGVEGDAGNQGSYHGLKGRISDDFIALGEKQITYAGSGSVYSGEGPYYVMGFVRLAQPERVTMRSGSMRPERIWIDHMAVDFGETRLAAGFHVILLKYAAGGRTHFLLTRKEQMSFSQKTPLAMTWYENPSVIAYVPQPWHEGKACRFRFAAPPGTEAMRLSCDAEAKVEAEGTAWHGDGWTYRPDEAIERCREVSVTVSGGSAVYGPALMAEPVRFSCGQGIMNVGRPIEAQGLKHYSGGIRYMKDIWLEDLSERVILRFAALDCAALVYVNGAHAGTLVAPPYELDVTDWMKRGENHLEIVVHNTLRNHMRTIPTNFLYES